MRFLGTRSKEHGSARLGQKYKTRSSEAGHLALRRNGILQSRRLLLRKLAAKPPPVQPSMLFLTAS